MILPEAFIERTKLILGEEFPKFEKALDEIPPTSIRINNKIDLQLSNDRVDWCENGFYLKSRPLFTSDPLFHGGAYYVQEASSMFLYQAIKQHFYNAKTVLDLCAAPGGKSTLLTQALPEDCLIVSNEIIRSRAHILAENIVKWGNPMNIVTNNEPKDFSSLPAFFDAMIVDAPCSGEGMFRKDAGAIKEWSEHNVKLCAQRQREILNAAWDTLKTDGILVYSTCTYNREENEDNVQWACNELNAEILTIDIQGNTNISVSDFGYRFYPHKTRGEGFFLAVLKKKSGINTRSTKNSDTKNIKKNNIKIPSIPISLLEAERWKIEIDNNIIFAFDKERFDDMQLIKKHLKCMQIGIALGEIKGKDFIPAHGIALSKKIDKTSVETVEIDYNTAISYLKSEAIQLPLTSRGYKLVCYQNLPLGWVKNVGNRCNNLYPHEWRIRMKI